MTVEWLLGELDTDPAPHHNSGHSLGSTHLPRRVKELGVAQTKTLQSKLEKF